MNISYSIIIPHKNIPFLLKRCLDSIPKRKDVQVIVVDDNSSFDSRNLLITIVNQYPQVELYLTHAGGGAGYARNVGLQHALGKWILFADADDLFTDSVKESMDYYLMSSADIIVFRHEIRNSETLEIDICWLNYDHLLDNKDWDECELLLRYTTPWGKFFRSEFRIQHHLKFEEVPCSNDVMFICRAAIHAKQITIDRESPVYIYTTRAGSLVKTSNKEFLRCRLDVAIRASSYQIKHRHSATIMPDFFLKMSTEFGRLEFLRTLYLLVHSKLLFHRNRTFRVKLTYSIKIFLTLLYLDKRVLEFNV